MKNYLITLIDKEGNQKKIGCQSENINTAVAYATSQMQMPFTVVSVEELGVAPDDKLTSLERLILESTDERWKYIARDEEGYLILFAGKPNKRKSTGEWFTLYAELWFAAFEHLFQDIQWKDKEPYKFR